MKPPAQVKPAELLKIYGKKDFEWTVRFTNSCDQIIFI